MIIKSKKVNKLIKINEILTDKLSKILLEGNLVELTYILGNKREIIKN